MTDNLNITGPDKGSTDAGSNSPVDAAVKDANSSMSFEPVGDGTVVCPSTASAPPGMRISQEKSHWIAIELVDEHDKPVPGKSIGSLYQMVQSLKTVWIRRAKLESTGSTLVPAGLPSLVWTWIYGLNNVGRDCAAIRLATVRPIISFSGQSLAAPNAQADSQN